eukprot:scaffold95_cov476-Prasinococcus_capsulatus_cf.AAC.3
MEGTHFCRKEATAGDYIGCVEEVADGRPGIILSETGRLGSITDTIDTCRWLGCWYYRQEYLSYDGPILSYIAHHFCEILPMNGGAIHL